MSEIIEKYKKYLVVNGCAYATIASYIQRVSCFLNEVKLEAITTESIRDYLFTLQDKFSSSTLNIYKCAIKSFLTFLEKDDIKVPKYSKRIKKLPEYITLKFLENNVIPMAEVLFDKVLKTKTVLYFMFFTGLRVSEVASLKREDFNLENLTVKVYSKKNKTERILPYPKKIRDILEQYFCFEEENKTAFNIRTGGIKVIFQKLNPYFKDINLHCHIFRHSAATHWRKCGVSIENIQYLLGHSNIQSTMIYAHADCHEILMDYYKRIK